MQLSKDKQCLSVIKLPRIQIKLPTRDGHINIQGKFVMLVHQLTEYNKFFHGSFSSVEDIDHFTG